MAQIKNSLIPCKFNNYYNRLLKIETDYTQYEAVRTGTKNIENYNFNPNDGITAEVVINQADEEITKADYLVVLKETIENNISTKKIDSRWFILECKRNRLCQYTLSLYRDSLADNFNALIDAPLFVEKSGRLNINDPAIFNNEDMSFNQIKTSETLLKDETKCAWVVGYIPRDFKTDSAININYPLKGSADITVSKLSNWKYYNEINKLQSGTLVNAVYGIYTKYNNNMLVAGLKSDGSLYPFKGPYDNIKEITYLGLLDGLQFKPPTPSIIDNRLIFSYRTNVFNTTANSLNSELIIDEDLLTEEQYAEIAALNDKIIYDKETDTYYKITVSVGTITKEKNMNNINIKRQSPFYEIIGNAVSGNFKASFTYTTYTIKIEQAFTSATLNLDLNRYHLNDQPYDMFCIPYSDDLRIFKNNVSQFTANKELALSIGSTIASAIGSSAVYDVQLLPYCPVRNCIKGNIFDYGDALITEIKDSNQNTIGALFWANTSTFSFNINQRVTILKDLTSSIHHTETINKLGGVSVLMPFTNVINVEVVDSTIPYLKYGYNKLTGRLTINYGTKSAGKEVGFTVVSTISQSNVTTSTDVKISNECDMYRLCSPNYNGQFEFSLAKNGDIQYFNVDCSYRPFNPYIHVNPNFNKLYGKDFNDARGLVCGGDFSLTQITSAWANYELNNKNYQKIFDRNIQNLEVTQDVERQQQIVGTIASAFGAGISTGTTIGSISSGPIGAAVGLGTGAVSLTAGMVDYQLSEKLRNEAIDYRVDQFGYQLGNIKALPYGLSKISSLNENNKIFPFIEYYTCTDEEKEALKNKIAYNGASIGRIGTIREYLYQRKFENKTGFWYIKGKMIRLLDFGGDYQQLNVIASEMLKGIFISNEIVGE
jgi:hypothetical protein